MDAEVSGTRLHCDAAGADVAARCNFAAEWRGVAKPALVVQGPDDKQTPPGGAVILSRAIPGARLALLEQCGHNVMIDQSERFIELTLGFVREVVGAVSYTHLTLPTNREV